MKDRKDSWLEAVKDGRFAATLRARRDKLIPSEKQLVEHVHCKGYRFAVRWIALNDETAERDHENVANSVSVMLIADVFSVSTDKVATDVLRVRNQELNKEDDQS